VKEYENTWFKGNGYTPEAALFHGKVQLPLMENPNGIFAMDDAWIDKNLATLDKVGVKADKSLFDTSILAEL